MTHGHRHQVGTDCGSRLQGARQKRATGENRNNCNRTTIKKESIPRKKDWNLEIGILSNIFNSFMNFLRLRMMDK